MINKLMVLIMIATMNMSIILSGVTEQTYGSVKEITESTPTIRVMTGNYYDYMVVETVDDNEWLLDDNEESKYIKNDKVIFEDGELVQVMFDTKGTDSVKDDVVIDVRSIDSRY